MADVVLKSQQRTAGKFLNNGEPVDTLQPMAHMTISAPTSLDKNYIQPNGTAAFGSWLEFDLPNNIYLSGCAMEFTFGALSSGNYCNYPALAVIDEIELLSGSNKLQSHRYAPVMRVLMSRMTPNQVSELLNVSGSTSFASGVSVAPLPLFFSRILSSFRTESPTPLNTSLLTSKLRLRIKLRSAADVAASGATVGTPTISTKLHVYSMYSSDANLKKHLDEAGTFMYYSSAYQTLPQSTAVATATSTTIDASAFRNSLSEIILLNSLVSNIDTAHSYFVTDGSVTNIKAQLDGKDYWICESNAEIEYNRLLFAEFTGATTTLGDGVVIPFAQNHETYHYGGSLEKENVNKLNIVFTHTAGANTYVDLVARQNVYYVIENGYLKQVE